MESYPRRASRWAVPADFRLTQAGDDFLLGVRTKELGTRLVQRLPLVKPRRTVRFSGPRPFPLARYRPEPPRSPTSFHSGAE